MTGNIFNKIGIIGGGAWGTALGCVAVRAGRDALIWAREPDVASAINETHENPLFLKGIALEPGVRATASLADMADRDLILLVAPAQFLRATLAALVPHLTPGTPLVLCAKGVEASTGLLMNEVIEAVAPGFPLAVLSGPTFAAEVARGLPAAVTLACADKALGNHIIASLGYPAFRPYWSDDLIGAEVGGAVKNVLAIACGIVAGQAMGENARAAVITRGMAEMMRFAVARGARPETLMGLCGLGDLILTCSSTQSRNMSLGKALGEGVTLAEILASRNSVAEGVESARILSTVAAAAGVEMPICTAVYRILHEGADVTREIAALLARPFTRET